MNFLKKAAEQFFFLLITSRISYILAYRRLTAMFIRTKLGPLWITLTTLISSLTIYLVYSQVFQIKDSNYYFTYLVLGIAIWSCIAGPLSNFAATFTRHKGKLLNTNLRPSFFIMEELYFSTLNSLLVAISSIVILLVFNIKVVATALLWLPLAFLVLILFTFNSGTLLAYMCSRFKDFSQALPLILQLTFITSPIMYPKGDLGGLANYLLLNPLYLVFEIVRSILTTQGKD